MWIKQGRIFNLELNPCRTTHAQVPTPFVFDNFIRVYYACRDTHNQSYPAYFDLSFDLKTVLNVHETSIIERGKPGMFDSDGVMPSCVVRNGDELWMYYVGWNELSKTARYHNATGVAVSKDGGESFQRMFDGPILDRLPHEPGLAVLPFVMFDEPQGVYKMWYDSGTAWHRVGDKYEPVYVIKYAESEDGVEWDRWGEECIRQEYALEALSRPCVLKTSAGYDMYYCSRHCDDYRGGRGSYRLCEANSTDGTYFIRDDDPVIKRDRWDSDMQCYPYVIELNGQRIMFFNGNDFGQTGIGLAIWQDA